jgi:geranylgeranylglycerol-phosphate geranylgeranyltransferase
MSVLSIYTRQKTRDKQKKTQDSFLRSQWALFQSRKKWGILYSLATAAGLFCVVGMIGAIIETEFPKVVQKVIPLPFVSLLIATGMYVLNDLIDSDLDKANGKKRPIPSGQVSKKQALSFVLWTNLLAVVLSIVTLNTTSMLLVIPMLIIGILYSAPKIALADRFVVKSLSIALFYMLCALLGITSAYGQVLAANNPMVPLHAMFMLGIMIFISTVVNDLGDIQGDRAAGRRTIPVVIGRINTAKMTIILACGMAATTGIFYATGGISLITVMLTTNFAALVTVRMTKTLKGLDNIEFIRKQHKKMFPLHMILQLSLVIGTLL